MIVTALFQPARPARSICRWAWLLALSLTAVGAPSAAATEVRRLVLRPEAVRAALPLTIALGDQVQGRLWVDRLDGLRVQGDRILCDVRMRGAALNYQPLDGMPAIALGDLVAEMAGEMRWRFDAPRQVLTVTPRLTRRTVKAADRGIEDRLLQLLALANEREWEVPLEALRQGLVAAGLPAPAAGERVAVMQAEAGGIVMQLRSRVAADPGPIKRSTPAATTARGRRG